MADQNAGVPAGFRTVTPYLVVDDASEAIEFYERAFGAQETFCLRDPRGRVMHAEVRIGDSPLMLAEGSPDYPFMQTVQDLGGSPIQLYLYLDDADPVYKQALLSGAEVVMPLEDNADGDRRGGVRDPFGVIWWIAMALDPDAREKLSRAVNA
jgi:PhnB protein